MSSPEAVRSLLDRALTEGANEQARMAAVAELVALFFETQSRIAAALERLADAENTPS